MSRKTNKAAARTAARKAGPDPLVERGRKLVTTALALVVAAEVVVLVAVLVGAGTARVGAPLVRLLVTALLAFMVYRGEPWARWVAVVLFSLALVLTVPLLLQDGAWEGERLPVSLALVPMAAIYLFVTRLLIWSPSAAAFLKAQHARYGTLSG